MYSLIHLIYLKKISENKNEMEQKLNNIKASFLKAERSEDKLSNKKLILKKENCY